MSDLRDLLLRTAETSRLPLPVGDQPVFSGVWFPTTAGGVGGALPDKVMPLRVYRRAGGLRDTGLGVRWSAVLGSCSAVRWIPRRARHARHRVGSTRSTPSPRPCGDRRRGGRRFVESCSAARPRVVRFVTAAGRQTPFGLPPLYITYSQRRRLSKARSVGRNRPSGWSPVKSAMPRSIVRSRLGLAPARARVRGATTSRSKSTRWPAR